MPHIGECVSRTAQRRIFGPMRRVFVNQPRRASTLVLSSSQWPHPATRAYNGRDLQAGSFVPACIDRACHTRQRGRDLSRPSFGTQRHLRGLQRSPARRHIAGSLPCRTVAFGAVDKNLSAFPAPLHSVQHASRHRARVRRKRRQFDALYSHCFLGETVFVTLRARAHTQRPRRFAGRSQVPYEVSVLFGPCTSSNRSTTSPLRHHRTNSLAAWKLDGKLQLVAQIPRYSDLR